MAHKHRFDYFDAFVQISNYAVEYADELADYLMGHYDEEKRLGFISPDEVLERYKVLHDIEERSDSVVQEITENLIVEFIAPIEREDILELADELDTVVDELDDVLQRIYMHNVTVITPGIIEMVQVVQKATHAVQAACDKFTHFKKSKSIQDYIKAIHEYEDEGDRVYIESVHRVYKDAEEGKFDHPLFAVGLYGVLSALEKCCDACECAGDIMVTVRLKNS